MAFTPFLTRLYGPEAFGVSAAFTAVMSIITPLATLGYATAIVIPEGDKEAAAIARLSILCALILAPISLLAVHLGQPWIAILTGLQDTPQILYLIPLSLIITAFLSVANQSAIRKGLFKAKARAYVESALGTNLGKLGGGLVAPSGLVLILLTQAGQMLNLFMQLLRVPRQGVLKPSNWIGVRGVGEAAKAQRDFAVYRMPQSIIRAMAMGLPVIVLTALFGSAEAGQYSLTLLILGAPAMLLGDSVGEVFYPKITRAITGNKPKAQVLIVKAIAVLGLVGVATFGLIVIFGDVLVPWLFGAEWGRAGEYSQWVAVWMTAMLATRPAVASMPALELQSVLLLYEIVVTAARAAALYVGFLFGDDLVSIAIFSLINVAGYVGLSAVVLFKAYRRNSEVLNV
ncbi:oligosaccharide flippase family protein [Marinobacter sp. C7]|uniref:lipopolysaccharide biosynthesis protein n=1 Tax=Marinobacter sp. C7 TaxID=2951363 RepID=UPI001EF034F3|nr:oligosaccharide flippase family protein [Marinobacter sp. C7]